MVNRASLIIHELMAGISEESQKLRLVLERKSDLTPNYAHEARAQCANRAKTLRLLSETLWLGYAEHSYRSYGIKEYEYDYRGHNGQLIFSEAKKLLTEFEKAKIIGSLFEAIGEHIINAVVMMALPIFAALGDLSIDGRASSLDRVLNDTGLLCYATKEAEGARQSLYQKHKLFIDSLSGYESKNEIVQKAILICFKYRRKDFSTKELVSMLSAPYYAAEKDYQVIRELVERLEK